MLMGMMTTTRRAVLDLPTISGLNAWYDAADASTITTDTGGVSQWSDKSGNARHATQSNSGNRPNTGSSINGLNAIGFNDANSEYFNLPSGVIPAGGGTYHVLIVGYDNGGSGDFAAISDGHQNGGSDYSRVMVRSVSSTAQHFRDYNNGNPLLSLSGVPSGLILLEGYNNGTVMGVGVNQTYATQATNSANNPGNQTYLGSMILQSYLSGSIGEVLVYNNTLSPADATAVRGYLADKWGLL
jgi:hypothetical protein